MHTDLDMGDPAGLEALAQQLDVRAGDLANEGRRVRLQADASRWQCPSADRFRSEAAGWQLNVTRTCSNMTELAAELRQAAQLARETYAARAASSCGGA